MAELEGAFKRLEAALVGNHAPKLGAVFARSRTRSATDRQGERKSDLEPREPELPWYATRPLLASFVASRPEDMARALRLRGPEQRPITLGSPTALIVRQSFATPLGKATVSAG